VEETCRKEGIGNQRLSGVQALGTSTGSKKRREWCKTNPYRKGEGSRERTQQLKKNKKREEGYSDKEKRVSGYHPGKKIHRKSVTFCRLTSREVKTKETIGAHVTPENIKQPEKQRGVRKRKQLQTLETNSKTILSRKKTQRRRMKKRDVRQ